MKHIASLCLASIALSGCANLFRTTPAECEPLLKAGLGSISVAGLVIPTGVSLPVKIGNATYTPQQVQRLTDSAQQIEQYRLGQCGVLSTLIRLKPQPVDRIAQIAESIAVMNLEMQKIAKEVPITKNPESQVESHEAAASSATIKSDSLQPHNKSQTSEERQPSPKEIAAMELRFQKYMDSALLRLERGIASVSGHKPDTPARLPSSRSIVVNGFPVGDYTMTTRMKANLLFDLQETLGMLPSGYTVSIDVMGYADITGSPTKNVELGLHRARAVASFIAEHSVLQRAQLRNVSSGGAVEIAPFGRQVRLLLTPSHVEIGKQMNDALLRRAA